MQDTDLKYQTGKSADTTATDLANELKREIADMNVSKQSIRKCIKLICEGRLCDECPIQEQCLKCTHNEGVGYDTTIDEFLYLFDEITK